MPTVQDSIIIPGGITLAYAQALASDIPADRFGRTPEGVKTNSPAFIFGHLALYPDRVLGLIGREDKAEDVSDIEPLFKHGAECKDDPDHTIYPSKDALVGRFSKRHEAALLALQDVTDDTLAKPNPVETMRDRFPTVGAAVTFLMAPHAMMHLGQLSTWRRVMGLGPVM
jgi:hypothetical protein